MFVIWPENPVLINDNGSQTHDQDYEEIYEAYECLDQLGGRILAFLPRSHRAHHVELTVFQ